MRPTSDAKPNRCDASRGPSRVATDERDGGNDDDGARNASDSNRCATRCRYS
jgi:hypothetical protein